MAKNKPGDIEVKACATHHVIMQPNPLRSVLRRVADDDRDDPVARAEKALEGLSAEFNNWMVIEADRLSAAWDAIRSDGFTALPLRVVVEDLGHADPRDVFRFHV